MSCSGSLLDNDSSEAITEDEAALYDRQIRLWGLDAQKRFVSCDLPTVKWNGALSSSLLLYSFIPLMDFPCTTTNPVALCQLFSTLLLFIPFHKYSIYAHVIGLPQRGWIRRGIQGDGIGSLSLWAKFQKLFQNQ